MRLYRANRLSVLVTSFGALVAATLLGACAPPTHPTGGTAGTTTHTVTVHGTVTTSDGLAIARAYVTLVGGSLLTDSARTDDAGHFSFRPVSAADGSVLTLEVDASATAARTLIVQGDDLDATIVVPASTDNSTNPLASSLELVSFTMGQPEGGPGYFYLPSLTLRNTTGDGPAAIIDVEFYVDPSGPRIIIDSGCLGPAVQPGQSWDMSKIASYCQGYDSDVLLTHLYVIVRYFDSRAQPGIVMGYTDK